MLESDLPHCWLACSHLALPLSRRICKHWARAQKSLHVLALPSHQKNPNSLGEKNENKQKACSMY